MTTATKSQEPTVEGVAFPPIFKESISKTSTIAETARLRAEIEELKRSVHTLLASNKIFVKSSDSDGCRVHRFATSATRKELTRREVSREMLIEIPNLNALLQEETPTTLGIKGAPTGAQKGAPCNST